jgi:hypothetical protein
MSSNKKFIPLSECYLNVLNGKKPILEKKETPVKGPTTLQQAYNFIREADDTVQPQPVAAPVTQSAPVPAQAPVQVPQTQVPQPTTSLLTDKANLDKFVSTSVLQRKPWNAVQKELFNNLSVTGIGRGELSVCSIFTNSGDIEENKKIVSGSSESYDVSFKIDNRDYLFEVKELRRSTSEAEFTIVNGKKTKVGSYDVRIGQEGAAAGRALAGTITHILKEVLNEYELLDEKERKAADAEIINLHYGALTEPVLKGDKITKAHGVRVAEYKQKAEWNIAGYANSILSDLGELTKPLMFTDIKVNGGKLSTGSYGKEKKKYALFSIKSFLQTIDLIASKRETADDTNTNPRLKSLKDVFNKNYGAAPKVVENPEILDKEAVKIDKKLSKETGMDVGSYSAITFFTSLKKENLLSELSKIENYISSPETLKSFFPHNLTGFFAVDKNGYIYSPREDLDKCLEFYTITQGKPKVRLKEI